MRRSCRRCEGAHPGTFSRRGKTSVSRFLWGADLLEFLVFCETHPAASGFFGAVQRPIRCAHRVAREERARARG